MQLQNNSLKNLFLLLGTAALAAVFFYIVRQYNDPSGGDGYFYLKQIEWLGRHFSFYHADYSFIFFPLAAVYKATGSNLLSFQILTTFSLFTISFCLAYFILDSLSFIKNTFLAVTVTIALTALFISQTAFLKISYEFAKNGFCLALLFLCALCVYKEKIRSAFIFGLLSLLTHKIAAVFFIVWLVLYYLKFLRLKNILLLGFGLLSIVLLSSFVFSRFLSHLKNFWVHFQFETLNILFIENQLILSSSILLILGWLIFAFIQFNAIVDQSTHLQKSLFLTLLLFSLIPFLPVFASYNLEVKFRLMILSYAFSTLIFIKTVHSLRKVSAKIFCYSLAACILLFQSQQFNGFPWIMTWTEQIKNLDQISEFVQPKDELVTHHGLQFYIDYKTPIRARSMLSEKRPALFQIAYVPHFYRLQPEMEDAINQVTLLSLGDSYSLFKYEDFKMLIKRYPILSDWRNQFQTRPAFVQDYN